MRDMKLEVSAVVEFAPSKLPVRSDEIITLIHALSKRDVLPVGRWAADRCPGKYNTD